MYRIFAKDFKVYLFDRRTDVLAGITVRDLAMDIAMAMDTLEITDADRFGVSQGGMIAQYLAIDCFTEPKRCTAFYHTGKSLPYLQRL